MEDKDFILKIIAMVGCDCLSSIYGNISSKSPLKEDKEILDALLSASGGRHAGAGERRDTASSEPSKAAVRSRKPEIDNAPSVLPCHERFLAMKRRRLMSPRAA